MICEEPKKKPKIAIFASPKCVEEPKLHKKYFNVAWFVRAYGDLLENYEILTTGETAYAVEEALKGEVMQDDPYWRVPTTSDALKDKGAEFGFDGQVRLAGAVARNEVERVLMFMDPLDTREYLPETYAFIRNCTLADVGLHINAGATYWAKGVKQENGPAPNPDSFGGWRTSAPREGSPSFESLLNPDCQTVHFIAHDNEKEKLSRFVYNYRHLLVRRASAAWRYSGTSGTVKHIKDFLSKSVTPPGEIPKFTVAGPDSTGHGPTGGDVVIADEIREVWPVKEKLNDKRESKIVEVRDVRGNPISHTVVFFIDYLNARPHEADIHVLLRTCLNPHRGVHLILNKRSAIEWAERLR